MATGAAEENTMNAHECQDCGRKMLEVDMNQDGRGDWFCPTCWSEAIATLAKLNQKEN
jgi:ribosomal protein L37AE/L43A